MPRDLRVTCNARVSSDGDRARGPNRAVVASRETHWSDYPRRVNKVRQVLAYLVHAQPPHAIVVVLGDLGGQLQELRASIGVYLEYGDHVADAVTEGWRPAAACVREDALPPSVETVTYNIGALRSG